MRGNPRRKVGNIGWGASLDRPVECRVNTLSTMNRNQFQPFLPAPLTRRHFLQRFGLGFGALSLAGTMPEILGPTGATAAGSMSPFRSLLGLLSVSPWRST